jgi:transcriptional regulator with XRE-family HTH domain
MQRIVEPKVRLRQALKVSEAVANLWFVDTPTRSPALVGFAKRMNELCDDLGIPAGRGRQTELAKLVGLNPNAARKWLHGDGYPNLDVAVALCDRAGVHVNWLLQGTLPKRIDSKTDTKALILDEALHTLEPNDAQQVFDFISFKIEKSSAPIVGERLSRYMKMLDAFRADMQQNKRPPNS